MTAHKYTHYTSKARPDVARKLMSLMTAQKRGRMRPEYGKRSGRIDRRNLTKAAMGDGRVFSKRGAPSPTQLRLVVLLDMSGSMDWGVTYDAGMKAGMQMTRDLIEATKDTRSITTEVWGHTTAPLHSGDELQKEATAVREGDYIVLRELWEQGQPIKTLHDRVNTHQLWGNEDGFAIDSLYKDVSRRRKSNERILFVVISDGEPVMMEMDKAYAHVRQVNERIRRSGDAVVSVSISASLRREAQEQMYGHDFVIEYSAHNMTLLQNIAKAIGKALN